MTQILAASTASPSPAPIFACPPKNFAAAVRRLEEVLDYDSSTMQIAFSYRWRGFEIAVEATNRMGITRLTQEIALGPLPFSAEDPIARLHLLAVVALSDRVPAGAFRYRRGKGLFFQVTSELAAPIDGKTVIASAARDLLRISPYLDLLTP